MAPSLISALSDWSAGITEALNQVEPYNHYQLSKRVKYPQYLQVFYDGTPVHPDEWRYDLVQILFGLIHCHVVVF